MTKKQHFVRFGFSNSELYEMAFNVQILEKLSHSLGGSYLTLILISALHVI